MLKGEVKIDLIDEKTGKIETYQDTNMVTNLVSDIFTYNPFQFHLRNYLSYFNQSNFSNNFTPIIPKIINGIILFDGDLDDDPDNYFQNNELGITAYANGDIHTTLDPKRGNPNLAEQTDLSNGYKFVYEFNTSQGNGIIKSLGLTSEQAGAWGHGSTYNSDCQDTKIVEHYKINEVYSFSENLRRLNSMTSIDPENNCGYFARCNSQGKIEVGTIRIPFSNIKLKENFLNTSPYSIKSKVIDDNEIFLGNNSTFYGSFVDGEDGFIWGFQRTNYTGESKYAALKWIKINKEYINSTEKLIKDVAYEEGLCNISECNLYYPGEYNFLTAGGDYSSGCKNILQQNHILIKNGILYSLSSNREGVYLIELDKIPLGNNMPYDDGIPPKYINSPVVIWTHMNTYCCDTQTFRESESGGYNSDFYQYPILCGTSINYIGGAIVFPNAYLINDTIFSRTVQPPSARTNFDYYTSINGLFDTPKPNVYYGPYLMNFATSYYRNTGDKLYYRTFLNVQLPYAYLATKYRLSTPIEKTPGKTMKITYTIKEID